MQGGAQFGSGMAPPLVAFIIYNFGWHAVFYVSAGLGLVVAVCWYAAARDTPARHSRVTPQELAHIQAGLPVRIEGAAPPVPWAKIFTSKDVWGTALAYAGFGYAATIFSTWFFLYLKDGRGFDLKSSAVLGMLPFIATTSCCLLGGVISDWLVKRHSPYIGRSLFGAFTLVLSGVILIVGGHAQNADHGGAAAGGRRGRDLSGPGGLLCGGGRSGRALYRRDFRHGQHVRPDRGRGHRLPDAVFAPRNMAGTLPSRSRRA